MQKFTGTDYIRIDMANQYGNDKMTWDDRIAFIKRNETPAGLDILEAKADEPILFAKARRALRDALAGTATGTIMGLDATASGIQIMACLTGCKITAAAVNLIDTGKREDVYQSVADTMSNITGETLQKADVKKPVMTTFYGSKNQPEEAFGVDTPELKAFYETLSTMLPGAMECMNDMQGCWMPDQDFHTWTLPDGHVAYVKVMDTVDRKIEVDELDHATYTHRAHVNRPTKKGLSLAANIIHSVDAWVVREQVRRACAMGIPCLTIHDSFWSSPNFMNEVRQHYLDILIEIAESDMLEHILREITGSNGTIKKLSNNLASLMKSANYALS